MTWKIALPMYNVSLRIQRRYEALLLALAGEAGVDAELVRPYDLLSFWRSPDLLLSQTCGYPYMTQLRGEVTLLATPCFDFAGCEGSDYRSVIVVREGGGIRSLAEARGRVAAANDRHSHSGMNALRHAVAPLTRDGRFFASIKWSGSHAASLAMVRDGAAAIAAIDCATYGYLAEEDPDSLRRLSILQHTAPSPGLPLIAGRAVPDELTSRLRAALLAPSPAIRELLGGLHIDRFEHRADVDYERVLLLEAEAREAGYPVLT